MYVSAAIGWDFDGTLTEPPRVKLFAIRSGGGRLVLFGNRL